MAGIDVISNTTGQEMTSALNQILETSKELTTASKLIAAAQSVQARENLKSVTWTELARFANDGLITSVLDYGDMVNDTWTDKSVDPTVEYSNPSQLVRIEDVELENGEILKNRPLFQTHYQQLHKIPFSSHRAFYAATDGLAAGTYYIEFAQTWGKLTETKWTFTLTKDVPAGGRLLGFEYADLYERTSYTVEAYDKDGITVLETVTATVGSDGTALGICPFAARGTGDSTKCNSMQEAFYGCNRWKTSAIRQNLNSEAGKGAWWTPQDEWDIAPGQLATIPGWLSGCSDEFISNLKTIKVTTYTNSFTFDGSADITYDRVILPSVGQRFIETSKTGEGAAFEYWKRRLGRTSPQEINVKFDKGLTYNIADHSVSNYEAFRSASTSNAYSIFFNTKAYGVMGSAASTSTTAFNPFWAI